ncbi:hypothetical protein F66182_6318 [Fusarium sp. NRRL 66182]|nr:hypothetical protein F66182_6318 [Fusarium sp. NRRL 66182]
MSYSPRSPAAEAQEQACKAIWEERQQRLPRLPHPRPRALTPDSVPGSQAPRPFFQKSYAAREQSLDSHCGIVNQPSETFPCTAKRLLDESQPEDWQWWSSVCHRLPPSLLLGPMTNGGLAGPWADYCRQGKAEYCRDWRTNGEASFCYIGIMGWLLSCRQNYAETIDILYSTNTLVMTGEHMLTNLPRLLVSQRLEQINSLEITWLLKSRFASAFTPHDDLDEDHLGMIFKVLSSSHFLALQHLYISFEESDQAWLSMQGMDEYLEVMLKHMDAFAQRMAHLYECAFALPDDFFEGIYCRAAFAPEPCGTCGIELKSYRQAWRSIEGEMTVVQLPYVDSYPRPPYHWGQGGTRVTGYWILEGSDKGLPDSPFAESLCGTFSCNVLDDGGF